MMENQLPNGERLIEEPTYPEEWECLQQWLRRIVRVRNLPRSKTSL